MHRRVLNEGEAAILAMIQQGYGPQNSADTVFFTKADEAVRVREAAMVAEATQTMRSR
jgi:hypothetical protein